MESRITNSKRNIILGILLQIINILFNLITRKIFVNEFGVSILGLNGVLVNIISMLSLTELGIGIAISQSLYEPIAQKDNDRVSSIMQLYSFVYRLITIIVIILGIFIFPFLKYVLNTDIDYSIVIIAYALMVLDAAASYSLSYRQNLLIASQKKYIVNIFMIVGVIILNITQIIFMLCTQNYILFLIIKLCFNIVQNLIIYVYVGRKYPYIKNKSYKIDDDYKQKLFKNVRALVLANISTYIIFSTDNIVLSIVSGTIVVGFYSNYSMIITAIKGLISQVFQGVTASFGNYAVEKTNSELLELFKKIYFINFWLATFCATSLFVLLNKFINLWIGYEYILPIGVVFLLVWNFYQDVMRSSIETIRNATGLYSPYPFFKFWIVIEAVINIAVSFILGRKIGIYGVFIGTALSGVVSCYIIPRVVYRFVFKEKSLGFYMIYIKYQLLSFVIGIITYITSILCSIENEFLDFAVSCLMCVIIPNILIAVFFSQSEEFRFIINKILKK